MKVFQVDKIGYKFKIESNERLFFQLDSEPADVYQLRDPILRKLLFLVDEEYAEWIQKKSEVVIPHESIFLLDREELDLLGLPDFYPYGFGFRTEGRITSATFKLQLEFKRTDDDVIVNPKVSGTHIAISSTENYLLDKQSYSLIKLVEKLHQIGGDLNKKLGLISHITEHINALNEQVPEILKTYEIEELDSFDVRLEESTDGTLSVFPVPIKKVDETKNRVLNKEEEKQFHEQFGNQKSVRSQYLLEGNKILVYNSTVEDTIGETKKDDVLNQFKKLQKLQGKEKKAFINNPGSFFSESERVDLSDFSERVKSIGRYVPVVLPFVMQSDNDWFPTEGGIIIDGEQIKLPPESREELISIIEDGLESDLQTIEFEGRDYNVNEETLEALNKLKKAQESKGSDTEHAKKEVEESQNTVLIIKDNFFELEQRGKIDEIRDGKVSLPISFNAGEKLYNHQEDGLRWLQDLWIKGRNGALLADDMGLGKTIQALLFCAWVKEQKLNMSLKDQEIGPFLVVAPVALLDNWDNEYHKFLDWSIFKEPLKLHGTSLKQYKIDNDLGIRNERDINPEDYDLEQIISERGGLLLDIEEIKKYDLILTTYETIRDYQFSLSKIDWSVMVLDEIQKIKNPDTLATHAVKAMNYNFGLGLTGTPVENSWVDLWSIMDFVQPGHLGTLVDFNDRFEKKLNDPETDKEELGNKLKDEIGDLLRRRFKEDHIKELPKKNVKKIPVELTDYQKKIYSQVLERASDLENDEHVLTQLLAIRDISLCPYLPFKNEMKIENIALDQIVADSTKIKETFNILDKVKSKNEKAIIFLISRKTQSVLQRLIIENYGIKAHIINGTVTGGRRQNLVDKFQKEPGFNVIIMSPEAAGVGLNVTAANHVIHLSRHWNPAKEDQASDRVYRIGQEKNVTIYIPIATYQDLGEGKSFDEILDNLLKEKRHLSRSVLLPAKIEKSDLMTLPEEMLGAKTKRREYSKVLLSDIDGLNGHQFEHFCELLYSKLKFNVDRTNKSRDKGVDLIIREKNGNQGFLVQCKAKDNPGRKVDQAGVQEVVSGKNHYSNTYRKYDFELVVITNAIGYTNGAKDLASSNSVTLLNRSFIEEKLKESGFGWEELVLVNSSN